MQQMLLHHHYATYTAAYPSKVFEAKLIRFGQIWLDLGDIWANLSKI